MAQVGEAPLALKPRTISDLLASYECRSRELASPDGSASGQRRGPPAHPAMPASVSHIYDQAMTVADEAPHNAVALLTLALQILACELERCTRPES